MVPVHWSPLLDRVQDNIVFPPGFITVTENGALPPFREKVAVKSESTSTSILVGCGISTSFTEI